MPDDSFGFRTLDQTLAHRAAVIRAVCLYFPIVIAAIVYFARRRPIRTFASPLLSLLWALTTLVLVQRLNLHFHWWTFEYPSASLVCMPVSMYLGWAVFWGLLPQFSFRFIPLRYVVILAVTFDFYFMLLLNPALSLNRDSHAWYSEWLVGEIIACLLVLLPAMLIFRWTDKDTRLLGRAWMQVLLSGLVFLYLLPEIVFALRPLSQGWQPLRTMPGFERQLWLQIVLLAAVPGISAVQEFATRGHGTPLPYDPPRRLVTSGIYRYCANPMQLSCAVVMLLEAALLRNVWLIMAALMAALYSAGLAHWDEEVDLSRRFGPGWQLAEASDSPALPTWTVFRSAVPAWRFRLRPYHAGPPATLYVAATCPTCSGLRHFLESHSPTGLTFADAEALPHGSIRRLRYLPADGGPALHGVEALAHALEHLHLGWAYCGFLLRLPVISHTAQLVADTAGCGPQLPTNPATCSLSAPAACPPPSPEELRSGSLRVHAGKGRFRHPSAL